MLKIDLGSGHSRKDDFLRVDLDPTTNPDFICDASRLDPIKDNSVDVLHSAHLLEHYDPEDTFRVLREWWRVLKPSGELILIVPDAGGAMKAWSRGDIRDCCLMRALFGSDPKANEFMRHKNLFWAGKLMRFLFITGFVCISDMSDPGSGELRFNARKPHVTEISQ